MKAAIDHQPAAAQTQAHLTIRARPPSSDDFRWSPGPKADRSIAPTRAKTGPISQSSIIKPSDTTNIASGPAAIDHQPAAAQTQAHLEI